MAGKILLEVNAGGDVEVKAVADSPYDVACAVYALLSTMAQQMDMSVEEVALGIVRMIEDDDTDEATPTLLN